MYIYIYIINPTININKLPLLGVWMTSYWLFPCSFTCSGIPSSRGLGSGLDVRQTFHHPGGEASGFPQLLQIRAACDTTWGWDAAKDHIKPIKLLNSEQTNAENRRKTMNEYAYSNYMRNYIILSKLAIWCWNKINCPAGSFSWPLKSEEVWAILGIVANNYLPFDKVLKTKRERMPLRTASSMSVFRVSPTCNDGHDRWSSETGRWSWLLNVNYWMLLGYLLCI